MRSLRDHSSAVRALVRVERGTARPRDAGDRLGDQLREAVGPQAGSSRGGRMTGSAVDDRFENDERD